MPVYSSHLLRYADLRLGQRVRDARVRNGWTLKELASRAAVSPARLSEIENEHHRLDLRQTQELAHALGVPLEEFLPSDIVIPYQISREAERDHQPWRVVDLHADTGAPVPYHNRFRPLADMFVGRHLEPVLARVLPVSDADLQLCCHNEQEFVFIIKGTVEFIIVTAEGTSRETLERGDCVYFRSDLPHALRSCAAEPAESLHVFSSPSSPSEPGLRWSAQAGTGVNSSDPRQRPGNRIRMLRDIRGWTTQQVSAATGVVERHLKQIEEGQRSASVETLLTLARFFGKPLTELVGTESPQGTYYSVQRSTEIASVPARSRRTPVERPHAPKSKICQPMAGSFPAEGMYPYFLRLLNVELETLTLHEHHGQEFMYVLEGELDLVTYAGSRRVSEVLRPGDSCYLDSTVPHLLRSSTRNPYCETSAAVIDVFWSPLGEDYLFDVPHRQART
jgi:transcriptional regulator with XRE-family HTH domain/uncharacterized cupin superfamily protein